MSSNIRRLARSTHLRREIFVNKQKASTGPSQPHNPCGINTKKKRHRKQSITRASHLHITHQTCSIILKTSHPSHPQSRLTSLMSSPYRPIISQLPANPAQHGSPLKHTKYSPHFLPRSTPHKVFLVGFWPAPRPTSEPSCVLHTVG